MNHEHDRDELIDLGAATIETKGPAGFQDDHQGGLIPVAGLGDD